MYSTREAKPITFKIKNKKESILIQRLAFIQKPYTSIIEC